MFFLYGIFQNNNPVHSKDKIKASTGAAIVSEKDIMEKLSTIL